MIHEVVVSDLLVQCHSYRSAVSDPTVPNRSLDEHLLCMEIKCYQFFLKVNV